MDVNGFPDWSIPYLPANGAPGGSRYKIAFGGRGSSKSWTFAKLAVMRQIAKPSRILCARELQISIKDSVHHLIAKQIEKLNAGALFEVGDSYIRTKAAGGEFLFKGLRHNAAEIKSMEGIKICWAEEAQSVSEKSWDWLIPTIREDNSEIWVSFNPELDTDPTYQRFVVNPFPGSIVRQVNYTDNPWFPNVLEMERQHAKRTMPKEDYENIWEGKTRKAVAGAIYANEMALMHAEGRIRNVPYDPMLKVHRIWDLGWNDSMTIIMVQRVASEIRVIDYIEDSHHTLNWYVTELNKRDYNVGTDWLPHDGEHRDFKTGKSAKEILEALGCRVEITPNVSIEDGIRTARMMFTRAYVDKDRCGRLLQCLARYRRRLHQRTGEPMAPEHDEFSHGADAWRYLGIDVDMINNSPASQRNGRRPGGMAA
jgi:phage terminase large subunit